MVKRNKAIRSKMRPRLVQLQRPSPPHRNPLALLFNFIVAVKATQCFLFLFLSLFPLFFFLSLFPTLFYQGLRQKSFQLACMPLVFRARGVFFSFTRLYQLIWLLGLGEIIDMASNWVFLGRLCSDETA